VLLSGEKLSATTIQLKECASAIEGVSQLWKKEAEPKEYNPTTRGLGQDQRSVIPPQCKAGQKARCIWCKQGKKPAAFSVKRLFTPSYAKRSKGKIPARVCFNTASPSRIPTESTVSLKECRANCGMSQYTITDSEDHIGIEGVCWENMTNDNNELLDSN